METKQEFKMIPVQTKSLDHIRCDSKGNVLCVNDKNQFFFNGEKVYEGRYLYFDLHNGNYAISRKEDKDEVIYVNGKRAYTLKKEDLVFKEKMFYQFQMEDVPLYWRVLNGKLVTIEKECLYYDGKLLLKENQFDDYRVIGDHLFVEKETECKAYEVNLSDGEIIEVEAPKLDLIKEDGEGKFLFAFPNQFFRDGKMFFHLGWYLHNLGKKGNFKRFEWNRGVFAFEVGNTITGEFRDIRNYALYVDGNLIEEKSDENINWDLLNGKLLILKRWVLNNNIFLRKSLFCNESLLLKEDEFDNYYVINHHLFIKKGKKFYQVLLPE